MQHLTDWLRERAFERMDKAFETQILGTERYKNAHRAHEAFWALVKAKVPVDVYEEIHSAYLEAEPVINARHAYTDFVYYTQGFFDGMQVMGMEAARLYHHDPELERENTQRDREAIRKLEQAAMNGATEKVGV